jgi:hypothetical protein
MPALTNHRRELFAQLLFQGFTAVDAYENAGYKRHDGNASVLARHPEVQARLEEMRGESEKNRGEQADLPVGTRAIAARAKVTAESLVEMARTTYDEAMDNKQFGAANGSIREMGVLTGHRIERREIGTPGEFDHLTDDELERMLVEQINALGLTSGLALDVEEKAGADHSTPDAESDTRQ